jgi:hypothetical protein
MFLHDIPVGTDNECSIESYRQLAGVTSLWPWPSYLRADRKMCTISGSMHFKILDVVERHSACPQHFISSLLLAVSNLNKRIPIWSNVNRGRKQKIYCSICYALWFRSSVVDPNSFFSDSDSDPQIIFFGFELGFGFGYGLGARLNRKNIIHSNKLKLDPEPGSR